MWGSLVNWTIHVSPFVSVGIPQWVMKCAAFLLLFFMRDGDAVYPIQFNQVWFALCIKTAPILASRNTCAPVGGTHHYSIRLFQERTRGGWEISRERGRERGRWREKKRGRVREKKREEERERERERESVCEKISSLMLSGAECDWLFRGLSAKSKTNQCIAALHIVGCLWVSSTL